MTYNYTENDYKMSAFLTDTTLQVARAANAKIVGNPQPRRGNYSGGAAHHTGGAIMGTDPKTSALNRYLQTWEASNLFVLGGAAFRRIQAKPDLHDRGAGLLAGRRRSPRNI